MQKTGAFLLVHGLKNLGVTHTFGIPGTHTTELYDELAKEPSIEPVLVTHEGAGAFMADAVSRTTRTVGTITIVPAAGATQAMSGIGEAFLDGIPMLIISGGTRRDSGKSYQLHQIDQEKLVRGVVKKFFLIERHADVLPVLYEAHRIATSGEPGPVFIEVPVEILMFRGPVDALPDVPAAPRATAPVAAQVRDAIDLLLKAQHPGIYVGWGAVDAVEETRRLAERLMAPVATTLQGKSAFPASHPLHVGVGFGATGLPAGEEAFKPCDVMLAVGVRFGEVATGSYAVTVPEKLIHVDINPDVFHKNYPARLAIEGDALSVLRALNEELDGRQTPARRQDDTLAEQIAADKLRYRKTWLRPPQDDLVSPGRFFEALRQALPEDGYVVVDDGKHTFLSAELMDIYHPRHFISPTDFNCMGYSVPAAIGVKLTHPQQPVVAIAGDGAFLMTGMEMITARTYGIGLCVFVFHDGELGQIAQFQQIPLNRKTATVLGDLRVEGVALATGSEFIALDSDFDLEEKIGLALKWAEAGKPVIVDVRIDYSQRTRLTKGAVRANLARFPLAEKLRFIGRALKRRVTG